MQEKSEQRLVVVLHNIRSALNVGAIFRTAEAAGASELHLIGYTPGPLDRFGRTQKEIEKTALGAENMLTWKHHDTLEGCIDALKSDGFKVVAVEQGTQAQCYRDAQRGEAVAFVFGNEVDGLSQEECALCDEQIEIPMHGEKESLNVSVAVGVILFSAVRACCGESH